MKLSYSIQVCNESRELFSLLNLLIKIIDEEDEINVIVDSNNKTQKVERVISHFRERINAIERPFDTFKKNSDFHGQVATGDYIFAIDADEMPQESLIKKIKEVITETGAEIVAVPRINIHPGITEQEAKDFGFVINDAGFINWPDFQTRIWKKCDHITWTDEVHTKLTGSNKAVCIQPIPSLALWHIKSMEKQNSRWKQDDTGTYNITAPSKDNLYDELM